MTSITTIIVDKEKEGDFVKLFDEFVKEHKEWRVMSNNSTHKAYQKCRVMMGDIKNVVNY